MENKSYMSLTFKDIYEFYSKLPGCSGGNVFASLVPTVIEYKKYDTPDTVICNSLIGKGTYQIILQFSTKSATGAIRLLLATHEGTATVLYLDNDGRIMDDPYIFPINTNVNIRGRLEKEIPWTTAIYDYPMGRLVDIIQDHEMGVAHLEEGDYDVNGVTYKPRGLLKEE